MRNTAKCGILHYMPYTGIYKLVELLQSNGSGCLIGGHFLGSVVYADDLTLLCPTAKGLQEQISLCEQYGCEYGMTYNPVKTKCVLFSRQKKVSPCLTLNGTALQWCDNIKHLGNLDLELEWHQRTSNQMRWTCRKNQYYVGNVELSIRWYPDKSFC